MELSKDDIKYIAYHRFNKSHNKHFYGLIFGSLALMIVLELIFIKYMPGTPLIGLAVVIVIIAFMYVGLSFYVKAQERAAKSFIEECEANPILAYVPEPPKND
jgi:hypothetical protein